MDEDKDKDGDKEKEKEEEKDPEGTFRIRPETTKQEFLEIVKGDEEVRKNIRPDDLDEIFAVASISLLPVHFNVH